jgi:hypothetical protein
MSARQAATSATVFSRPDHAMKSGALVQKTPATLREIAAKRRIIFAPESS